VASGDDREVMIMKNTAANADIRILCSIPKKSEDYDLDCCPTATSIPTTTILGLGRGLWKVAGEWRDPQT